MGANELKLHIDDSEVDQLTEKLEKARKEAEKLAKVLSDIEDTTSMSANDIFVAVEKAKREMT